MFDLLRYLHILCAIIGFGWLVLASLSYARVGNLRGTEALESYRTVDRSTKVAEWFVYGVFVTGLLTAFADPKATTADTFGQMWLSISMLLYIVAIVLSLAVVQPTGRKTDRLLALAAESPSPELGAELEKLGKRNAMVTGILHLLFVVILALMVFRPGS